MIRPSLIGLLLIALLKSCTEPYDFISSVEGDILVVEGNINNTDGPHLLYLHKTRESDGKGKINGGINNDH